MTPTGRRTEARPPSLWGMFADTARNSAASPALRDLNKAYTYAETYVKCMNAAGALSANGVSRGDTVLVCTDRTVDGVVALLAISAAGATPVPIEPGGPRPRFERIAATSGAHLALVDDVGRATIDAHGISTLHIEEAVSTNRLDHSTPGPSNLAYILFTSGSTGTPKGVEITQANMLSLLAGARDWDASTAADVCACYHAFTFDISMWEMWRPLTLGAEVFILPRTAQIDGDLAYSLVDEQGITVLCQTPTAARLLTNRTLGSGIPGKLRRLLLCGERLDFATLKPFAPAVADGELEIWNLYGPTEATIYSTAYKISPSDIEQERRSLIGRALPHVDVEVRNPDADGIGELWIAGEGVAAGYRGDPELTHDRFVVDGAGRRVYRTGDLVRDSGDGIVEFIGRVGGFVKVRGYRIEPGEIVSALCAHPAVEEAAAVVTDALPWGTTVVCAVVPRRGVAVTETALRRHVAALLPSYMRPARIVFFDALPRLPSTKLDELTIRANVEKRLGQEGSG